MTDLNEEHINMIMRQTDYTRETAQQKLQEHNNNMIDVIREYMAPPVKATAPSSSKSVNQQIYKEIRGMMDDAARNYENKK